MKIELFLTPLAFGKAELEGKTVVIIDVLRSSTSICAALTAGARGVIPTPGQSEAVEMWNRIGSDMAVLAGEREGRKIENFTLGNSPAEFTEETVGGKLVVLSTTNGTAIFSQTASATTVIACGLVNISRVTSLCAELGNDLVIVCAGSEGGFSIEDTLCGGMLISGMASQFKISESLNDAASLAQLLYRSNKTALRQTIEQGEHGRYLSSIGFSHDVVGASEVDSLPVLPILRDGRLVPGGQFAPV
jgi:2-phosphosulfolactate phosphatase